MLPFLVPILRAVLDQLFGFIEIELLTVLALLYRFVIKL
jgi:hypothetical protein